MDKKFKYKLEGLLKLRKFKEDTLKMELGKINRDMVQVKGKIEDLKSDVSASYDNQERFLKNQTKSRMAQFYPSYIKGRKQAIENEEARLSALQKKYQRKLTELSVAMGETKVISNMKENEFDKFRKNVQKKEQEKNEEMIVMRKLNGEKQW